MTLHFKTAADAQAEVDEQAANAKPAVDDQVDDQKTDARGNSTMMRSVKKTL